MKISRKLLYTLAIFVASTITLSGQPSLKADCRNNTNEERLYFLIEITSPSGEKQSWQDKDLTTSSVVFKLKETGIYSVFAMFRKSWCEKDVLFTTVKCHITGKETSVAADVSYNIKSPIVLCDSSPRGSAFGILNITKYYPKKLVGGFSQIDNETNELNKNSSTCWKSSVTSEYIDNKD